MAYDKERKDKIDRMCVADLVHTMLVEFDPAYKENPEGGPGWASMQNNAYFWAYERLVELLPIEDPK